MRSRDVLKIGILLEVKKEMSLNRAKKSRMVFNFIVFVVVETLMSTNCALCGNGQIFFKADNEERHMLAPKIQIQIASFRDIFEHLMMQSQNALKKEEAVVANNPSIVSEKTKDDSGINNKVIKSIFALVDKYSLRYYLLWVTVPFTIIHEISHWLIFSIFGFAEEDIKETKFWPKHKETGEFYDFLAGYDTIKIDFSGYLRLQEGIAMNAWRYLFGNLSGPLAEVMAMIAIVAIPFVSLPLPLFSACLVGITAFFYTALNIYLLLENNSYSSDLKNMRIGWNFISSAGFFSTLIGQEKIVTGGQKNLYPPIAWVKFKKTGRSSGDKLPEWFKIMDKTSYYEILEIEQTATSEKIKKAYRKLAKKYHSDTHLKDKDEWNKVFQKLKEAYDYLSHPEKRGQEGSSQNDKQDYYPDFDMDIGPNIVANNREWERTLTELRAQGLTADTLGLQDIGGVYWAGDRVYMSIQYPNPVLNPGGTSQGVYYWPARIVSFESGQIRHWDFECYTHLEWKNCPGLLKMIPSPNKGDFFVQQGDAVVILNSSASLQKTVVVDLDSYKETDEFSVNLFPLEGTKGIIMFPGLDRADYVFSKDGKHLIFLTQTGIVVDWDIDKGTFEKRELNFSNSQPEFGTFYQYETSFNRSRDLRKEGKQSGYIWPLYQPEVRLSPDGTLALIVYERGYSDQSNIPSVEIWDIESNECLVKKSIEGCNYLNGLWDEKSNVLLHYTDKKNQSRRIIWDWAQDTEQREKKEQTGIKSPNGRYLAWVNAEGKLEVTNTATGAKADYEIVFSFDVKYEDLNPRAPVMKKLNEYAQLNWNPYGSQLLVEQHDSITIVRLKITELEAKTKSVNQSLPELRDLEFTSFDNFIKEHFEKQGVVSFADIGCEPEGEFGQQFLGRLKKYGITASEDSVSVDNLFLNQEALQKGWVKYADIEVEEDRNKVGLRKESKDIVFINNIINSELLKYVVPILKPNGLLMVTFALTDKEDCPNIIKNSQEILRKLSEEDPEYMYYLLGENAEVERPQDYPDSNSLYASWQSMLLAIKIRKIGLLPLAKSKEEPNKPQRTEKEWLKEMVLDYHLEPDRLGASWRDNESIEEVIKKYPDLIKHLIAKLNSLLTSPYPDTDKNRLMLKRLMMFISSFSNSPEVDDMTLELCLKLNSGEMGGQINLENILRALLRRLNDNAISDEKILDRIVDILLPQGSETLAQAKAQG